MKTRLSRASLKALQKTILYFLIIGGATLYLVPLFWMISTSLKPNSQVFTYPIQWLPNPPLFKNYVEAWSNYYPFGLFFRNSLVVALLTVVGNVLVCPLVAYSFVRLKWPLRDTIFFITLLTMMIPYPAVLIPQFILFNKLNWINTYLPFVVPAFGGDAFYIFLMRQLILTIPSELDDAARIDGCGSFNIYRRIILPLVKPGLAAIAIFEFIKRWNDFLGPLIYLTRTKLFTFPLGLNLFRTQEGVFMNYYMAISCISMLPCLLIFLRFQKYFIQGIVVTGLKE